MSHQRKSTAHALLFANGGVGAFCNHTGFSEGYAYACLRGEKRPSSRFRKAVCSWLGLEDSLVWPESENSVFLTQGQIDELRASLNAAARAVRDT